MPIIFSFFIGGYHGENIKIRKYYNSIEIQKSDAPIFYEEDKVLRKVSRDEWIKFWRKIDKINIWNWQKDYFNPHILDGTQWELIIQLNDKKRTKIFGSNSYPENFQKFLNAINSIANTKITFNSDFL